jgi:predicted DNA-binding transcriptional regulator YafY
MQKRVFRLIKIINAIPKHPKKISVTMLQERLDAGGFQTTKRTIQRDLNELSEHFPLVVDTACPAGWSRICTGDSQQEACC